MRVKVEVYNLCESAEADSRGNLRYLKSACLTPGFRLKGTTFTSVFQFLPPEQTFMYLVQSSHDAN